ncbi:MAG TPA: hypothetical protein PLJ29_06825, partial [Leptospiraceae bacterium]|nr:hypothetical protein [Leptospiraceae bacterium]
SSAPQGIVFYDILYTPPYRCRISIHRVSGRRTGFRRCSCPGLMVRCNTEQSSDESRFFFHDRTWKGREADDIGKIFSKIE